MLTARPQRLAAAVSELSKPRQPPATRTLRIEQQRQRLLAISPEKISRYRINPRALEILPELATLQRDPELQQRVIALSIAQLPQMPWKTLSRLTPWIYTDDAFRGHLREFLTQNPPPKETPVWLAKHWRAALNEQAPARQLAAVGCQHQPVRAQLLRDLQLSPNSPLGERVLTHAVQMDDVDWLGEQPFTQTLRFIEHSSASVAARHVLLRKLLNRYGALVQTPQHLNAAMMELFSVAHHAFGGLSSHRWHGVCAAATQAAQWCAVLRGFVEIFGEDDPRAAFWRRWLSHVRAVDVLGEDVTAVWVGTWVFAEPRNNARLCRVYDERTWMAHCRAQAQSTALLAPPVADTRIPVQQGRHGIEAFLRGRLGLQALN